MWLLRLGDKDDEYGVSQKYGHGDALSEWGRDRYRQYDLWGVAWVGGKNREGFEGDHLGAIQ